MRLKTFHIEHYFALEMCIYIHTLKECRCAQESRCIVLTVSACCRAFDITL